MSGEYDRLRELLLEPESGRLAALDAAIKHALSAVPDVLATDIEQSLSEGRRSRLSEALAEATTGSLELAVSRNPQAVVKALFPIIGPAIRRALREAMRQIADDLDSAVESSLGIRALRWRIEAWRSGLTYAQVAIRHTSRFRVEYLYLIDPKSGLLLGHLVHDGLPELDADAVAGMFTAIHHFVRDSMSIGEGGDGIGAAAVGEYRLVVSEGPAAQLVAFVTGTPPSDFRVRLDKLCEQLHGAHSLQFSMPEALGQDGAGFLELSQLDELNQVNVAQREGARFHSKLLLGLMLISAVSLATYVGLELRWALQSKSIFKAVSRTPGLVISRWGDEGRGEIRVEGLIDPLADHPRTYVAKTYPEVEVDWRLQPFLSLAPVLIERRAAAQLQAKNANLQYDDGHLKITGLVPFREWYRITGAVVQLPGVTSVDASELTYRDRRVIDAHVAALGKTSVLFENESSSPEMGAEEAVTAMVKDIRALAGLSLRIDGTLNLMVRGCTDDPGSYVTNSRLREARAGWLATALMRQLGASYSIMVDNSAPCGPAASGSRAAYVNALISPRKA